MFVGCDSKRGHLHLRSLSMLHTTAFVLHNALLLFGGNVNAIPIDSSASEVPWKVDALHSLDDPGALKLDNGDGQHLKPQKDSYFDPLGENEGVFILKRNLGRPDDGVDPALRHAIDDGLLSGDASEFLPRLEPILSPDVDMDKEGDIVNKMAYDNSVDLHEYLPAEEFNVTGLNRTPVAEDDEHFDGNFDPSSGWRDEYTEEAQAPQRLGIHEVVASHLRATPAVPAAASAEDGDGSPQLEDIMTNRAIDFTAADSVKGEHEDSVPLPSTNAPEESIMDGGDYEMDDWSNMQEYEGLAGSAVDLTLADEGAMGELSNTSVNNGLEGHEEAGMLGLLDEQVPTRDLRHLLTVGAGA